MNTPNDRKYSITDEWVKADGEIATIGISDYAQDQLSDIVFVEIAVSVGDKVTKNAVVGTIESVKAAGEITFPVSGEVVEINETVSKTPELVNSDPYAAAWMVKVKMADPSELHQLMDASAYEKYCQERGH